MAATAQLLGDLAEDLAAAGHTVTALTGRGGYAPGRAGPLPARERWRGVEIRRVWSTDFRRGRVIGRLLDYLTFFVSAAFGLLRTPRADVVVLLSTPPLVALLGLLARWRGASFVYKVEDLYPDVAVALGSLRAGGLLTHTLAALSRGVLRRADLVVALDGVMAATLRARGARRVEVIPNWADGEALAEDPAAGARFRAEQGLGEHLVVLYSGNLGLAHRFDAVVAAARELATTAPEVLFLFVGAGPRLAEVQAGTAGFGNVRFLPYQPREALRALYSAADIHLVTLRDEVAGLLVPSKYAAALAGSKPVLLVGGRGTDLHNEITREGLGWALPHDPQRIAAALVHARSARAELVTCGKLGRNTFERNYARVAAVTRWQDALLGLLDSNRDELRR